MCWHFRPPQGQGAVGFGGRAVGFVIRSHLLLHNLILYRFMFELDDLHHYYHANCHPEVMHDLEWCALSFSCMRL